MVFPVALIVNLGNSFVVNTFFVAQKKEIPKYIGISYFASLLFILKTPLKDIPDRSLSVALKSLKFN